MPPAMRPDRTRHATPEDDNGTASVSDPAVTHRDLPYASGADAGAHRRTGLIVVLVAVVLLAGVGALIFYRYRASAAASVVAAKRGPAAVPVMAAMSRAGDMDIYLTGLGAVTPLNVVTLHTRVDGEIEKLHFVEGTMVQEHQLLFELDPRPFQVQLTQAQGQLLKDEATLKNARLDLQRYQSAPGSFTNQQIATQEATVLQSEGAIKTDQGAIDSANLNLVYCKITAPLTGKIGLQLVDPGNIVHATDTTGLAVIAQIQPIALVFSLPEDDIPQVQSSMGRGGKLVVDAYSRDLKKKLASGTLLALDNQVDPTTGTVRFKGVFPNEDNALFPNEFVNARLLVDVRHGAVIAPSAAVQRSPQSTFVYVVKDDDTVEMRDVAIGPSEGDDTIVEKGLKPGEVVVTDGVDKLQEGSKVSFDKATLQAPDSPTDPGNSPGQGQPGKPQQ
jgi:membrane fusion protein, multidrug efflux system